MHLAATWSRAPGRPAVAVACVDHALRDGSGLEGEAVVGAASALGLPAVCLRWEGTKPKRGVPAAAREARYALLAGHARSIGASHIVTAHTLDDQAETILMRLAAGSGLSGLAGMREAIERHGLVLSRPLLDVPKAELVALCTAHAWRFFDDPTNHSPVYARSRWRAMGPALAREGLTAHRLVRFARRMRRADLALDHLADDAARSARLPASGLAERFDFGRLAAHSDEILIRVLSKALVGIGGRERPRLDRVEHLAEALLTGFRTGSAVRRTAHGCVVTLGSDGMLSLAPESQRRRGRRLAVHHIVAAAASADQDAPPSLGKPRPASYIGRVDAPARLTEVVEPHSASATISGRPMLCTGPQ